MTKLKLSPITHLSDARFAAAAGFTYMGFCFDPSSPQFLLPIKAKEIIDWTSGSYAVGEFGNQDLSEIKELSELLNLDVISVDNSILPNDLAFLGKPIIKVINFNHIKSVELANELCAYAPFVDAFQLNGSNQILGHEGELKEAFLQYNIIWNLPFDVSNFQHIKDEFNPFAFNLMAVEEDTTGFKDYDKLNELLELIGD